MRWNVYAVLVYGVYGNFTIAKFDSFEQEHNNQYAV